MYAVRNVAAVVGIHTCTCAGCCCVTGLASSLTVGVCWLPTLEHTLLISPDLLINKCPQWTSVFVGGPEGRVLAAWQPIFYWLSISLSAFQLTWCKHKASAGDAFKPTTLCYLGRASTQGRNRYNIHVHRGWASSECCWSDSFSAVLRQDRVL